MFNKKYPGNPVSLLETLVTRYGDVRLAQALVTAKQQGRSMDIVEGLQSLQLKWWLNSQTSADDVFLRLNFKKDGILSSPKIATMVNYIDQFNSKFPDHQTDLFTTLKSGFGEGKFAIIAHSARAVDDPLAGFEHNLFQGWIKKKYSPEDVLRKVFKIDKGKLPTDGVEKSIIAAYEPVYYDALTSNLAHRVGPRRS
ncbi:hypothetical protein PHMEG_00032785 [Phytophthora megakarya]|uniref:RxLR effector protein n=1 Tax=Phytophthora megakarya TaxID=4795 RepID=A0A225UV91_9STRA|nr:hypothetical protein PHMEG_00032785 [Phytophthora megakarya]